VYFFSSCAYFVDRVCEEFRTRDWIPLVFLHVKQGSNETKVEALKLIASLAENSALIAVALSDYLR
jgi:hypothetical protein